MLSTNDSWAFGDHAGMVGLGFGDRGDMAELGDYQQWLGFGDHTDVVELGKYK